MDKSTDVISKMKMNFYYTELWTEKFCLLLNFELSLMLYSHLLLNLFSINHVEIGLYQ